jgi:(S)-2-hydroxy-acid oxidase
MQRLCHAEGEVATSKAAASVGLPMAVSTFATRTIEDIIAPRHPDTPYIMQLYVFRDRQLTVQLIRRAEAAGYQALAVTIDAPVHGQRRNEVMNKFRLPEGLWFENLSREGLNQTHVGETAESGESIVKDSAINLHDGYLNGTKAHLYRNKETHGSRIC